jgi:protein TonB
MGSWKVLETSNELFSQAAKDAVRGAKFYPAEVGGRKVRQLVQLPLAFTLNK